jgi:hypothetical protein
MPELQIPHFLPEEGDRTLFKQCILDALTSDLSFHSQIKEALSSVGFHVARIEKHWFHNVYELRMRRGAAMGHDTENQLRGRIRRALMKENINYDKDTFVLSVQGQRLVCAFCYRLGAEGTI